MIKIICPICKKRFEASQRLTNPGRKKKCCSRSCARKQMWNLMSTKARKKMGAAVSMKMRGRPSWNKGLPWPKKFRLLQSKIAKVQNRTFIFRQGNGHGMTRHEKLLTTVLPPVFVWNYAIALGGRQPGYPTNYKVDFANVKKKLAIEVDGSSHSSIDRQKKDRKKEARLRELGWRVLRISNSTVQKMFITSR